MAEIAIVASRKSKLQKLAGEGDINAKKALELSSNPSRFLSTVQVGITLVGILAGAFGGTTVAQTLSETLKTIPVLAPVSEPLAITFVVLVITYLSLIIGELVPKRIALHRPELIASWVAKPMDYFSKVTSPIVDIFTSSTDWILDLFHIPHTLEADISEEEVTLLIKEGARRGIFERTETDIVERTLRVGNKKVSDLMTPRAEIIWIKTGAPFESLRNKIAKYPRSYYPVCRDNPDTVIGIVRTEDLLTRYLKDNSFDLELILHKPLFVPENVNALKVLELFKKTGIHLALIVDEYGSTLGLVSLTNILEAIVGDIPRIDEHEDVAIMKRENGTFLIDGLTPIDEFKEYFHVAKLPDEVAGNYQTVGGFVTFRLSKIPVSGDKTEWDQYRFEVVDMDGNRVDKVLLTPIK